jgi:RinA family phage transcriptional activator
MRLPKHIKKYLEGELTNYPIHKKALTQARQNIYLQQSASGYGEPSRSSHNASPVEHKVMYLLTERNIQRLENSVAAIEAVLNEMPEEYKMLIELKYFKLGQNQYVADSLNICLRTLYHWRDRALALVAIRYGFL